MYVLEYNPLLHGLLLLFIQLVLYHFQFNREGLVFFLGAFIILAQYLLQAFFLLPFRFHDLKYIVHLLECLHLCTMMHLKVLLIYLYHLIIHWYLIAAERLYVLAMLLYLHGQRGTVGACAALIVAFGHVWRCLGWHLFRRSRRHLILFPL